MKQYGDITKLSGYDLEPVDLIVGGPPCQSYSTVGKRRLDARANLFLQYKRVLSLLQPRAFVFENVVGILSMDQGRLFKRVQSEFESLGYDLSYKVLDAADYGYFRAHTYHLDVRFEAAFTQMGTLADAVLKAVQNGKRVIVEHFDLIYPMLGINANLMIGMGEEIIITRPTIFGPLPIFARK